jgi:hypothetical protein
VTSAALLRDRRFLLACCLTVLHLYCCAAVADPPPPPQPVPQSTTTANDYALIVGTVWGPDQRPVPGVPITIRRATDKKPKWELVSDRRGEFAQRVPPGRQDYIIQANIKVPKGQPKPELTVAIEDNERKDVGLHLTNPEPNKN